MPSTQVERPEHDDLWPVCVALIIGAAVVGYLVGLGSLPHPPDIVVIRSRVTTAFNDQIADARARGETVAELMLEKLKTDALRILNG
jgi:hypothetical protein